MGFICLFFPAIIMCRMRGKVRERKHQNSYEDLKHLLFEYVCCCIFLNLFLWLFLVIFRNNKESIYNKLNWFSVFAIKYMIASVFLAIIIPFAEEYLRKNVVVKLSYNADSFSLSDKIAKGGLIILAIVLVSLHFIRIFDNTFKYDEMLPLLTERMNWSAMLEQVARWGHTPFHYIIIWISCRIFGYTGSLCHLVSFLPYFVIAGVAVSVVQKWFGMRTAAILLLQSSLLENAVMYNMEVRMYSLCQMFVLLVYLVAYQIFHIRRTRYFVLITLFSLGAVYSHYFALAPIGIIYLFLLFYLVKTDLRNVWKVVLSGGAILFLFFPWMWFVYRIRGEIVAQYVLEKLNWRTCLEYIFDSKYSLVILILFVCIFIITSLYQFHILRIERKDFGKTEIEICVDPREWNVSCDWIWSMSGVCATFGTIVVSQLISEMLYPILTLRYLYPSLILMWLLLGICVSKCYLKKWITIALVALVTFSCVPQYYRTVKAEYHNKAVLQHTLETTENIDADDYIMTNNDHVNWPTLSFYYPDVKHDFFRKNEQLHFDTNVTNWLFLETPITKDIADNLEKQGYSAEQIVSAGYIGMYRVWVYKIIKD